MSDLVGNPNSVCCFSRIAAQISPEISIPSDTVGPEEGHNYLNILFFLPCVIARMVACPASLTSPFLTSGTFLS